MWWRRRSARGRATARLVADVDGLRAALDEERRTPEEQRPTGATTTSVLDAVEAADAAWQALAWSDAVAAGLAARSLADSARDWVEGAPLTVRVRELGRAADELLALHPEDPRLAPPEPPGELHPRDPRLEPVPPPTSELLLPDALDLPSVVELVRAGDPVAATKEYRAQTGVGLRDAQTAVERAARRLGTHRDP